MSDISPRESITKEAYKLFHGQGYRATSMREIADGAGMTQANLYHHFDNKDHIMIGVLEMVQDFLREKLFSQAYIQKRTPDKRLSSFIEWQEEIFLANSKACFLGQMTLETARENEKFATLLESIFKEWEDALSHLYGHLHSKAKARELAEQTVIEFEGAVMLGLLRKDNSKALERAKSRALKRIKI